MLEFFFDKSVENLTLEASRQGFVFAKVDPNIQRDAGTKKLNITYNITEGPRTYIERIDIVGNYRTEDEVIRRELNLYEGDAFNRVVIERARRRLTALDYFDKIDFTEDGGGAVAATLPPRARIGKTGVLSWKVSHPLA